MPSASRLTLVTKRSSPTSWHLGSDRVRQRLPAGEVVLGHAVLDRYDGIARHEVGEVAHLLVDRTHFPFAFIVVSAILEEFG